MPRTLYELENVESPFVWRSKYALAHKGLAYVSKPTAFTDIPGIGNGTHTSVPMLVDDSGVETGDSKTIAAYLDATYPDTAPLLDPAGLARADEVNALIAKVGFGGFFPLYIKDIWTGLPEKDAAYFRASREERFGATLEDLSANRAARLPDARAGLAQLRDELGDNQWFCGDAPGYADYIVLAFFAWLKGCATTPPLAAGDVLVDYVQRGFALYGGIGETIEGGPIAA